MPKFSERVGAVQPASIQLNSINEPLRNSIWNFILHRITKHYDQAVLLIGRHVFKCPAHKIPNYSYYDATDWLWRKYEELNWHEVYDLLEYVVTNSERVIGAYSDKKDIYLEINTILAEEVSAYRFIQDTLSPISDSNEVAAIEEATALSNKSGLQGVRTHLQAALELLGKKPKPDYRNSIKESISSVEAAVKLISGEHGGGLDTALKELAKKAEMHPALQKAFVSLYGYSSDQDGIRHAILEETNIGFDEAKFMLVACSAFVSFLIGKAQTSDLLDK